MGGKTGIDREQGTGFLAFLWVKGSSAGIQAKRLETSGTRLALAFAGFVLLLMWLSMGSFAVREWHNVHAEADHDLMGTGSVLQAHIDRTYSAARNMLALVDDWLVTRSSVGSRETLPDLLQLISRAQAHDDQPLSIRLVDQSDRIVRSLPEREGPTDIYVGDRDYVLALRDAPAGTTYVGSPITSRVDGRTVLPVVIRTRANSFGIKYVSAVIQQAFLADAYDKLLSAAIATIGLVRADGTILFTLPEDSRIRAQLTRHVTTAIAATSTAAITMRRFSGEGATITVASAGLAGEPLTIFVAMSESEIWQRWLQLIMLPTLFAVMASAAVFAFTHWLIRLMQNSAREAERLAAALTDAQAANQSKQQFLANMSHELRTPLNAIIGFSELMAAEKLGPLGNANYRAYADDILNAGRHLLTIISDILDTAKMNAGKIETGDTLIPLSDVLAECEHLLQPRITAKQLVLNYHLPANLPDLRMDRGHLKRVLINLIGNAAKFNARAGRIDIAADINRDGALALTISDTGIGIPPSRLDKLFRPFSQVEDSLNRNHDGIGLGLANTRLIIEAYGGHVWLESEVDRGTVAHVVFPARCLNLAQH
ncbi:MAG TPA: ATP-binding protein [Dongiaceae bacterium]|nr:ATP-binding protein [Dongiaceae bacterium]